MVQPIANHPRELFCHMTIFKFSLFQFGLIQKRFSLVRSTTINAPFWSSRKCFIQKKFPLIFQQALHCLSLMRNTPLFGLNPMAQRRPTRQESRRSLNGQSQTQLAPPIAPSPPTINVTIGRVEVRASTPVKRSEPTRQGAPKLSLEDYLRGRRTGNK